MVCNAGKDSYNASDPTGPPTRSYATVPHAQGDVPFAASGSSINFSDWSMISDMSGVHAMPQRTNHNQTNYDQSVSSHSSGHTEQAFPKDGRLQPSPSAAFGYHEPQPTTRQNSSASSIRERIELVIKSAHEAGFEGLEHVTSVLHHTKFEEGSACSNAQRLGRLRRLPNLIDSLILEATSSWSERESASFQDAILRAGEAIVVRECRAITREKDFSILIDPLLATRSDDGLLSALEELQTQVCRCS